MASEKIDSTTFTVGAALRRSMSAELDAIAHYGTTYIEHKGMFDSIFVITGPTKAIRLVEERMHKYAKTIDSRESTKEFRIPKDQTETMLGILDREHIQYSLKRCFFGKEDIISITATVGKLKDLSSRYGIN